MQNGAAAPASPTSSPCSPTSSSCSADDFLARLEEAETRDQSAQRSASFNSVTRASQRPALRARSWVFRRSRPPAELQPTRPEIVDPLHSAWEERVANLRRRFPGVSSEIIASSLRLANGHGGDAQLEITRLTGVLPLSASPASPVGTSTPTDDEGSPPLPRGTSFMNKPASAFTAAPSLLSVDTLYRQDDEY